jgi:hypothetical protein
MQNLKFISRQRGAALILMSFLIGIGVLAYLLHAFDPVQLQLEQQKKTNISLVEAKNSLIYWAVSNNVNLGQLPFPDRNADGNYDGRSDCNSPTSTFSYSFLIGQLPIYGQTNPCISPQQGLGLDVKDTQGNRLWYAVSRNLVHKYDIPTANPVINPSIINSPVYPWLRVLDINGNVISDRVAAVIMAPNNPIGNQNRTPLANANANAFLDSPQIGAVVYDNSNYDQANEDFILGQSDQLNDTLVYITIEELLYALEKRVLEETKKQLKVYKDTNHYYPYAAGLGLTANANQCVEGNMRGLLPLNAPLSHTCNCSAADKTCRCNFSIVNAVSFTRSSGVFVETGAANNSPTGGCSVNIATPNVCTCSSAGSCKNSSGANQFFCDACGTCTASVNGVNTFNTTGTFSAPAGGCSLVSTSNASCDNGADGSFALNACSDLALTTLPTWFQQNEWEKYIVYAVSQDCVSAGTCLSTISPPKIAIASLDKKADAIVATSLANPNNACNISNYLTSPENTNVQTSNGVQDILYQKTLPRTNVNSDQLVVTP